MTATSTTTLERSVSAIFKTHDQVDQASRRLLDRGVFQDERQAEHTA